MFNIEFGMTYDMFPIWVIKNLKWWNVPFLLGIATSGEQCNVCEQSGPDVQLLD